MNKKISENGDSALMSSTKSDIIDNGKKENGSGERIDRHSNNPMSYILTGNYKRIPHRKVGTDAKRIVAICASTGGPKAVAAIFQKLPVNLNAPVLLVQHMPRGFTSSLAKHLDSTCAISIKEAEDGEMLEKGKVYIAKGGAHLKVLKRRESYYISLSDEAERSGLKPCADIMYESLEKLDFDEIICVVLTGMGSDGTRGIGKLGEKKNIYVIAQDEATSTVYGMPGMVKKAGLADAAIPLNEIADAIIKATGTKFV
ncbi:MAG: chemotaxis protein CheB [Lachnospiraceae bacterium]|nr:chemotaxis protein CheB [Lachnospiraceae bacterium]